MLLNGFSENEIYNLRYGETRFTEFLEQIYNQHSNNFEPINNMTEWSKNIYIDKNGTVSSTNKINIGKTILMTLDDASTDEQSLAGYILTFMQIINKSAKLVDTGIPITEQIKILDGCYEHLCSKSFWTCYQIELHFHNLTYMHGGQRGLPGTKNYNVEP